MELNHPIIYIHKWSHSYLETSIKQSLKNNKKIILIWDKNNEILAKKYWITHILFDDYNINNFEKHYVHDTRWNSNYNFELICFQRWFVLLEVMKGLNIDRCLYLDSDILYFWNIDVEFKRISSFWEYDLAFPNFSWHTTYIFSQKILQDFCEFMINCYKDKKLFNELQNRPLKMQPRRSDMSIFQLYIHKFPEKIFDLKKDHWDGIVYDWYINVSEWYRTIFWKKYFNIKNNKVYVYKNKKEFEMKTLHFQMHMKAYMWIIYNKHVRFFRFLLFFNSVVEKCYRKFSFIRMLRKKWKDCSMFK